jgi:hypothetical protein
MLIFASDTCAASSLSIRCTTTGSGRIERFSCVHHARNHLSPSRSTAGSNVDRSSAG